MCIHDIKRLRKNNILAYKKEIGTLLGSKFTTLFTTNDGSDMLTYANLY